MSLIASLTTLWAGLLLESDTIKNESKEVRDGIAWGIVIVNVLFFIRLFIGVLTVLFNAGTREKIKHRVGVPATVAAVRHTQGPGGGQSSKAEGKGAIFFV